MLLEYPNSLITLLGKNSNSINLKVYNNKKIWRKNKIQEIKNKNGNFFDLNH